MICVITFELKFEMVSSFLFLCRLQYWLCLLSIEFELSHHKSLKYHIKLILETATFIASF